MDQAIELLTNMNREIEAQFLGKPTSFDDLIVLLDSAVALHRITEMRIAQKKHSADALIMTSGVVRLQSKLIKNIGKLKCLAGRG